MKYDFDTIPSREGTCCHKYDKREEVFGCGNIIPMWIADMDFAVAPFITEAILRRAAHPVYGYEFRGTKYHESIMQWVQRRNGWKIESDWIEFTPGVVAGLVFAVKAFTAAGDGVVIQPPVYPPFAHTIESNGRKIINNPLRIAGGDFEIDFEDLDNKLARAKAFMFCNPHNPTGRIFTEEELRKVGQLCVKHNVIIISDEIHSDLVQKPYRHIHIASLSQELADRTVTLIAPSKTFNIAGLTTSTALIPSPELKQKFADELLKAHVAGGNVFGNTALEAAYRHGDQWLDELMEYIGGNVNYVKKFIGENLPSVKAYNSGGTFLVWLNFSQWEMSGSELKKFMVEKACLGLNDGREFGKEGTGFMRMNVGTSRKIVEKAMSQLLKAYKEFVAP